MKAIAVLRVSTDVQQIDDQRDELFSFIKSQGYNEIVPVEAIGASAVKLDDRYQYMVQDIKDKINKDKDINAVFAWHLNRLGRNEVVLMEFKEFFIKNHIQFICKNPYMKLLNDDGSVNAGMELAFSLFATMSKQEDEERKEKFKRAKKSNAAKGKYIGGNTRKFGYMIDEQGYFKADPEESKVVQLIFDLYSTGNYSTYTLCDELKERGIILSYYTIGRILQSDTYAGRSKKGKFEMKYPAIISPELFDRCAKIRQSNKLDMKRGEKIVVGARLVKCPVCGATCTSNSWRYMCSRHAHHGLCPNGFGVRQDVADELMYRFAYGLHLMYLINLKDGRIEEYKKELELVEEKIEAAKKKMGTFNNKKERIVESYLEGFITKKDRDLRLLKVEDDVRFQRDFINQLQEKRRAIMGLLEKGSEDTVENFMKAAETISLEDKYTIIHKHIESLVAVQESFGKRDPRTSRPNAVHITIKSVEGSTAEYLYFPRYYKGSNLYVLADGEWVKDSFEREAVYAIPL